jgi:Ethanolamine utilization protein EutJ (predicted chaperonin)
MAGQLMINPATYNIKAYQGATYSLSMTWAIGGTPVNLTNYTAAMQVRENPNATATVLSLTDGSGITLGGTAGTIGISVSATTMGSAIPGNYVYDLELNSGAEVTRLIQGSFAIQAEVTR